MYDERITSSFGAAVLGVSIKIDLMKISFFYTFNDLYSILRLAKYLQGRRARPFDRVYKPKKCFSRKNIKKKTKKTTIVKPPSVFRFARDLKSRRDLRPRRRSGRHSDGTIRVGRDGGRSAFRKTQNARIDVTAAAAAPAVNPRAAGRSSASTATV